jgi:hypothetical protein
MKNKILFISLFIVYFCNAQQQELIENTWYLDRFVVENETYFPPSNQEVQPTDIILNFEEYVVYAHSGCNMLGGEIVFNDEFYFFDSVDDYWGITLAECYLDENNLFESNYFYSFWSIDYDVIPDPFHYEISPNGESLHLIITNALGSKAYYNNTYLSTSEVSNLDFLNFQLVFYNNDLIIQSSKSIAKSIFIYDLNGRLILTVDELVNQRINVGSLRKGVYIVKVVDVDGNISTYKVRK